MLFKLCIPDIELQAICSVNESFDSVEIFRGLVAEAVLISTHYICLNPCPAEPGYILPLQTV